MNRELVFDVSVLARSTGPAVGIVRVTRELARWAHAHRPRTTFVVYDSYLEAFREIRPDYFEDLLNGRAVIDGSTQPSRRRPRFIDRLPGPLRLAALWCRNPRRRAIVALERQRLRRKRHGRESGGIERAQLALMGPKHRAEFYHADGGRVALLPHDLALGEMLTLDAQLVLCAGSDWRLGTIAHVAERKRAARIKVAFICHDMIPLLHPEYFPPVSARRFREMFHALVPVTDLALVTARRVAEDFSSYCAAHGLSSPKLRRFRLGADLPLNAAAKPGALRADLEPGRYALFVSTVEPRKGHRLLLSVWKRLLAGGVPQANGFKLAFVGRRGWLVDDLIAEIEADPSLRDSLLMLSGLGDEALAELYRNAAFGLFPSLYEGYGLPVVETFRYGKAMLASTGGALPEVVDGLSPCLDPRDEDAWFEAMRTWIVDPAARAPYEAAIRTRFEHPTWPEAAEAFFGILDQELGGCAAAPKPAVGCKPQ